MTSTTTGEFAARHIGSSPSDQQEMLGFLGLASLEELVEQTVPDVIRDRNPLDLPEARTEYETLAELRALADSNEVFTSLIGMGYYDTISPQVVIRCVLENPAWYTAYTPYQPEISQGRLEALLNFQTMVSDLTGMEIANASLLDEGTAAAEAMTLLSRVSKTERTAFLVDENCHPQTIAVVATRAEPLGIRVDIGDPSQTTEEHFGVLVQYPSTRGDLRDLAPIAEAAHGCGALVAVAADLLALCVVADPGSAGADVVVGNTQRFGVPLGFGGPHAAYIATREDYKRSLPGRLVGVSQDAHGRPALRLALQTREQHIRREKATSNICTAQVLLAVIAGFYGTYHGPDGLRRIASRVHSLTISLAEKLRSGGVEVETEAFFDTISVKVPGEAEAVAERARQRRINMRVIDADTIGISLDETTTPEIVADVLAAFGIESDAAEIGENTEGGATENKADADALDMSDTSTGSPLPASSPIPQHLRRTSPFMEHPVFHSYHSEVSLTRYIRRLADRDIALDRAMIPLGSCTMKLNAATEMAAVTWPEFSRIHPFAPSSQSEGYLQMIGDLEAALAEITGYDAVSLQPNAGSQGELAGLLAIRAYYAERGETQRNVCLIPSSAHGTNAASAVMAGMRVIVVACDSEGNVDVEDLAAKSEEHADTLATLMVTYPSTHGVFEPRIREVCDIIHRNGGQVYMDGANLNALVGLARPGLFGADVSHLNLHKTFCIPHGGGGPGVGPVAVRAHLAPFLPNHPLRPDCGPATGVGPISAAPWGSAGILAISWAYIRLMGPDGLTDATKVALLHANYLADRIGEHFPVLYRGASGRVAHECVIDLRPIKESAGVTVDDIAKRLIDFGFHAPTVSFPVAGTIMVEPTESEPKQELDRFCDAMTAIAGEVDAIAKGEADPEDNPLRNSPHTAADVASDKWTHPYSREQAAFPAASLRDDKYWPPVSRIDNAWGDRNLVCSCLPPEAYEAMQAS